MISYLVRRLLLFVPTILGATFIIFMLMALAPISIVDALLPPGAEMEPGQREEFEAYLAERYGLDAPPPVQYLRWLNNTSPVGLPVWRYEDPEVLETRQARRAWRAQVRPVVIAENPDLSRYDIDELIRHKEKEQDFAPLPGQIRWGQLPGGMFKSPDLGNSFSRGRPVGPILTERLPVTILLNLLALPVALCIAIITGIWSAKHRGGWQDWGTGTGLLAIYSLPVIWVGVMLIGLFANQQFLRWFPAGQLHELTAPEMPFLPSRGPDGAWERGFLLDVAWHLVLPVICLGYAYAAVLSKLTRTSVLETLGADYIRTARAKGLPENTVLLRHGVRNALIPLITFLAALLPSMVTGSIVVETIFSIDGMGRLVIESIFQNDREVFLSVTLVILLIKLTAYLLADVAYVIADPRVSYE